jgi:hypothetical protein
MRPVETWKTEMKFSRQLEKFFDQNFLIRSSFSDAIKD